MACGACRSLGWLVPAEGKGVISCHACKALDVSFIEPDPDLDDPSPSLEQIADWEADLSFLYDEFYREKGLAFQPWPSSRPS
jgi:hypothetical protein